MKPRITEDMLEDIFGVRQDVDYSPRKHARSGDPDTSHEAAFLINAREDMLSAARLLLKGDKTPDEVKNLLDGHDVHQRFADLERHNLARPTGEKRKSNQGRNMRVWALTPAGIKFAKD